MLTLRFCSKDREGEGRDTPVSCFNTAVISQVVISRGEQSALFFFSIPFFQHCLMGEERYPMSASVFPAATEAFGVVGLSRQELDVMQLSSHSATYTSITSHNLSDLGLTLL